MREQKRNGALDFWKFIFSLVIVIFHGKNLAIDREWIFKGGSIGVEFFFIVSGILMAASASGKKIEGSLGQDTFCFIKRKIGGLMPNLYIAWIIAFVVSHLGEWSNFKLLLKHGVSAIWELLFVTESGLMGYRANAVTWYISAMLLAMLFLYPLMRKYNDTFFYILAPLLLLFLMGYSYHEFKNLRVPHAWMGFYYKSIVRAIMGLLVGCIGYKIADWLKLHQFTRLARFLWSLIEWGGYCAVIIYSYQGGGSKFDWTMVFILGISVIITVSGVGILSALFQFVVFSWLGTFSFSLFLAHGYWSHKITYLFPNLGYWRAMPIYLAIAFGTGLAIMYVSIGVKGLWRKVKPQVVSLFIQNK